MSDRRFRAIVLAGERPGGNALAKALALPAGVLAPLAGRPCLAWVVDTLRAAGAVDDLLLAGPSLTAIQASADLRALLTGDDVSWLEPATGPAASALAAMQRLQSFPLLLTSGDHGLLDGATVDDFCRRAEALRDEAAPAGITGERRSADLVVGLVPHKRVAAAFPESRRTLLRFADGTWCGSNLFALLGPQAARGLEFWRAVEADRKRPWKIARHLGPTLLARYLAGRLRVDDAFDALSERSGCRVRWVPVDSPRAAVDVDSEDDWRLADRLLRADAERLCRR